MNLTEAHDLAVNLLYEHGLLDDGWSFKFDTAVKRFGCCKYRTREITLSRKLVEANNADRVNDTILHEIAHAIAGHGTGHGPAWKAVCRRIGARPVACYTESNTVTIPLRYRATCLHCSHVFHKARAPKGKHGCNRSTCPGRHIPGRDRILVWIDSTTGRAVGETITFSFNRNSPALQAAMTAARERSTKIETAPAGMGVRKPNGLREWNR